MQNGQRLRALPNLANLRSAGESGCACRRGRIIVLESRQHGAFRLCQPFFCALLSLLRSLFVFRGLCMYWAFLVLANVKDRACPPAIDVNSGFGVRTFFLAFRSVELTFVQNVRMRLVGLPCRCAGNAQWFLAGFLQRLYADLHQRFDFRTITHAVGANGFLPHFGKEQRIVAGQLGTSGTTSCGGQ